MKAFADMYSPNSFSSTRGSISATKGSGWSSWSTSWFSTVLATIRVGAAPMKLWPCHHASASSLACSSAGPAPPACSEASVAGASALTAAPSASLL